MDNKPAESDNNNHAQRNKGLSLFFGILLIIAGLFTINARIFISTTTIYFLGWVLLIGGGAECFASFFAGNWSKFFMTFVTGIIGLVVGFAIVSNPSISVQTFGLFLGIALMADGLFKFVSSLATRAKDWGWSSAIGIVVFFLGVVIWYTKPGSLGLIGLFIGFALILSGFLTITNAYSNHEHAYRRKTSIHHTI